MDEFLTSVAGLVEVLNKLPGMTMTVLICAIIGLLVWKLAIIGSIYGVLRLGINKTHDVLMQRLKEPPVLIKKEVWKIDEELCINDCRYPFLKELNRLKGIRTRGGSIYIHMSDVDWLREAIDEKIARQSQEEKAAKLKKDADANSN